VAELDRTQFRAHLGGGHLPGGSDSGPGNNGRGGEGGHGCLGGDGERNGIDSLTGAAAMASGGLHKWANLLSLREGLQRLDRQRA